MNTRWPGGNSQQSRLYASLSIMGGGYGFDCLKRQSMTEPQSRTESRGRVDYNLFMNQTLKDAVSTQVPLEVYLRSSGYEPDAEYVDGKIEERPKGEFDHAAWQLAIIKWFLRHEENGTSMFCRNFVSRRLRPDSAYPM
jgi:hypothetical protein